MNVTLEVLHVPDCPNLVPLLRRLREVTDLPITTREIITEADAATAGMSGSPTLLINDRDPFTTPGRECGVSCRIYRDEHGRAVPVPSLTQLRAALNAASSPEQATAAAMVPADAPPMGISEGVARRESGGAPERSGGLLSAWRTRALPPDPVHRAVHQAILRAFAATGRPPTRAELDSVTAGSGPDTASVLAALHELDAIRLTPDGHIAVAYPFSATPTRHRVRIGEGTDVYAMCAIDALGIAAMLGKNTRIDSLDPTTGQPITVIQNAADTRWDPPTAVVFLGADAGGGPSADCCCGYLNFFPDEATARAWMLAHPHIPGEILAQTDAQALGARLFGPLLTAS